VFGSPLTLYCWARPLCCTLAAIACALLGEFAHGGPARERPGLDVRIDHPEPGQRIGDALGFLAGRAVSTAAGTGFDVMFVIDRSRSTVAPSGADVDGDGETTARGCGWLPTPLYYIWSRISECGAGDSIFAAELAAVRGILEQLDPVTTRVGLVSFSGDGNPLSPDAEVRAVLTDDYARVRDALEELEREGARGQTNMRAAIQLAAIELSGASGAFSKRRAGAERIVVFLTDGLPTLPLKGQMSRNRALAIEAAVQASQLGIRIDTYGIGEEALSEPVEIVEMARLTQGVFTPVSNPRELLPIVDTLRFADITELEVENLTTGTAARYVSVAADGSFSALIEGAPGPNRIEVRARSSAGFRARRRLELVFAEEGEPVRLEPRLREQRNRLLEQRLADLRARNLEIQAQRDEDVRRELTVRIQEERERAQERVRRLLIETEDHPESTPEPEVRAD